MSGYARLAQICMICCYTMLYCCFTRKSVEISHFVHPCFRCLPMTSTFILILTNLIIHAKSNCMKISLQILKKYIPDHETLDQECETSLLLPAALRLLLESTAASKLKTFVLR